MNRNLVGSIYGRSSIKITHIIPIKNPETQATLDTQQNKDKENNKHNTEN